jgi:hypothetical protein
MALYAQPQASHPAATDQAEGPSLDDVAELCEEFGFVPGNNGALLTADVFRAPPLSPLPMLRDMITAAITRWRAPVTESVAQPVNLAELHDPDFSDGLTPSQHLDVVHGGVDPRATAAASPGLPPRAGHILRLAEIIREVDLQSHSDTFVLGEAALAEAILAHPGFSGCHDGPAAPAAQGVLEDRYEFSVVDSDDCEMAGGSAPTLDDAIREARNYLRQYNQDGPHRLELRRVLVLDHSEATNA